MEVTKLTEPETVAPFAGELIVTEPAGVGVEVGVCAKAWVAHDTSIASSANVDESVSCRILRTTVHHFENIVAVSSPTPAG